MKCWLLSMKVGYSRVHNCDSDYSHALSRQSLTSIPVPNAKDMSSRVVAEMLLHKLTHSILLSPILDVLGVS